MFSFFGVVIRSNRRSGGILIITPDCGHLYLLIFQNVCKNPSVGKFKGSEVLPL